MTVPRAEGLRRRQGEGGEAGRRGRARSTRGHTRAPSRPPRAPGVSILTSYRVLSFPASSARNPPWLPGRVQGRGRGDGSRELGPEPAEPLGPASPRAPDGGGPRSACANVGTHTHAHAHATLAQRRTPPSARNSRRRCCDGEAAWKFLRVGRRGSFTCLSPSVSPSAPLSLSASFSSNHLPTGSPCPRGCVQGPSRWGLPGWRAGTPLPTPGGASLSSEPGQGRGRTSMPAREEAILTLAARMASPASRACRATALGRARTELNHYYAKRAAPRPRRRAAGRGGRARAGTRGAAGAPSPLRAPSGKSLKPPHRPAARLRREGGPNQQHKAGPGRAPALRRGAAAGRCGTHSTFQVAHTRAARARRGDGPRKAPAPALPPDPGSPPLAPRAGPAPAPLWHLALRLAWLLGPPRC